jgi:hypothetical protein
LFSVAFCVVKAEQGFGFRLVINELAEQWVPGGRRSCSVKTHVFDRICMFSPTAVATERALRPLFRSNAFSSVQDSKWCVKSNKLFTLTDTEVFGAVTKLRAHISWFWKSHQSLPVPRIQLQMSYASSRDQRYHTIQKQSGHSSFPFGR